MSVSRQAGRRVCASRRLGAGLAFIVALYANCESHGSSLERDQGPWEWQVWTGADVSASVWLLYSGVTASPWSRMHDEGLKFRIAGGYREYTYSDRLPPTDPDADPREGKATFHARSHYAEILVGYLMRFGELTAKAFVGLSTIGHDIAPHDDQTIVIGDEIGGKAVVELWLNMGERGWSSLDMSFSSAHSTAAVRARSGYRVWPQLSLGVEAALNVDAQGQCRMDTATVKRCKYDYESKARLMDYARAGGFVRYELEQGELSLSMGALGDKFSRDGKTEIAPYMTVNWLTKF